MRVQFKEKNCWELKTLSTLSDDMQCMDRGTIDCMQSKQGFNSARISPRVLSITRNRIQFPLVLLCGAAERT